MSNVITWPEWEEIAKEHLADGTFTVEELLRHTWNTALDAGRWAVHDADPETYPGREHALQPTVDTRKAFNIAKQAVVGLKHHDGTNRGFLLAQKAELTVMIENYEKDSPDSPTLESLKARLEQVEEELRSG